MRVAIKSAVGILIFVNLMAIYTYSLGCGCDFCFSCLWSQKGSGLSDHELVKMMDVDEDTPAFVPGKVLYIRETGRRIHRRYVVC